ncbi:MAG: SRPBCC family protein [Thermoanaerobaculia bacterium]
MASGGGDVFDLPPSSPDYDRQKAGQQIAGYYFWLFPNTMLNVYPWGISVNIVRPLAPDRTRVSFSPTSGTPPASTAAPAPPSNASRPSPRSGIPTTTTHPTPRTSRSCGTSILRCTIRRESTCRRKKTGPPGAPPLGGPAKGPSLSIQLSKNPLQTDVYC